MPLFKDNTGDPFYNRKPVPDAFIEDVGLTGLSKEEEWANRERKMSVEGVDIRKFSMKADSGWKPQNDPYYGRKSINKVETEGVGETGLSREEEFDNRERKMSVNGVDIRKFGMKADSGWKPANDPYYGRKSVSAAHTQGIGETYNTPAEDYAIRDRKMSAVNFSDDPFQLVTGVGHRTSVSDQGGALGASNAATERRRSSAVAPDAARAAANVHGGHSGYHGQGLPPIRGQDDDDDQIRSSMTTGESSSTGAGYGGGYSNGGGSGGVLSGQPLSSHGNTGLGSSTTGQTSSTSGAGAGALGSSGGGALGSHGHDHEHGSGGGHTMYHDATTHGHDHGGHGLVDKNAANVGTGGGVGAAQAGEDIAPDQKEGLRLN